MKWYLISLSLLTFACQSPSPAGSRPLNVRRLESFLAQSNAVIPSKRCYCLILSPSACASCFGGYICTLSTYINKAPLLVICGKNQQKEVEGYLCNGSVDFFHDFDAEMLSHEPFMLSSLAFALLEKRRVVTVTMVNAANIGNYVRKQP